MFTIGNGTRSSSATSYLGPKYINRKNLHVLLHAQVTRVLPQRKPNIETIRFDTVEFAMHGAEGKSSMSSKYVEKKCSPASCSGSINSVIAKKEIVLSAGTIGTPHILMNSGIGDSSELQKFDISPLVNLPSVGRNLSDHPVGFAQYVANNTDTLDNLSNLTFFGEQLEFWKETHKGTMAGTVANIVGFLRLPDNSTIFEKTLDPSAGPTGPHFEMIFHVGLTPIRFLERFRLRFHLERIR